MGSQVRVVPFYLSYHARIRDEVARAHLVIPSDYKEGEKEEAIAIIEREPEQDQEFWEKLSQKTGELILLVQGKQLAAKKIIERAVAHLKGYQIKTVQVYSRGFYFLRLPETFTYLVQDGKQVVVNVKKISRKYIKQLCN